MGEECEERGIVHEEMANGQIRVLIRRGEACGACPARGGCQALGGQTRDFFIVLDNTVHATTGDQVIVAMRSSAVVKASTVLYLIPALGLLAGAVIGHWLARTAGDASDRGAVIGAVLGMGAGFVTSFLTGKRLAQRVAFTPVLIGVENVAATKG